LFDITEFHKSSTKELTTIKDRVRNLIGSANWGEEGKYKESILMNTLRRFIPSNFRVGTGFVVKKSSRDIPHEATTQIDLILYDSTFPVLFSEGDFVIVTPESVRGIVEVKTNIRKLSSGKLSEMVQKVIKNAEFISDGQVRKKYLFNGIFGYEGYNNIQQVVSRTQSILSLIKDVVFNNNSDFCLLNHICFNNKYLLRYWRDRQYYSLYNLKDLSFSFFISNVVYYLIGRMIEHESDLWFPIDKESQKTHEFNFTQNGDTVDVLTDNIR
jgi:hypothetical protein